LERKGSERIRQREAEAVAGVQILRSGTKGIVSCGSFPVFVTSLCDIIRRSRQRGFLASTIPSTVSQDIQQALHLQLDAATAICYTNLVRVGESNLDGDAYISSIPSLN
jgi:hypothetical protein